MPVEITVDSIDSVDESIRGAYVEVDGKFSLDPDKYADIKTQGTVQGLKKKNSELIGNEKKLKDKYKRYERFDALADEDLDEIEQWRENKDKQPPADQGKGKEELNTLHEKALKREKDSRAADNAAHEAEKAELKKKLRSFELTTPIRDAALKAGVLAEDMEVVLLDTASFFDLNEDGKPVVLQDGEPTEITLEKFFTTLYREKRPKFYAASGASGSGAPANVGARSSKRQKDFSEDEKRSFIGEHGYDEWKKLAK